MGLLSKKLPETPPPNSCGGLAEAAPSALSLSSRSVKSHNYTSFFLSVFLFSFYSIFLELEPLLFEITVIFLSFILMLGTLVVFRAWFKILVSVAVSVGRAEKLMSVSLPISVHRGGSGVNFF